MGCFLTCFGTSKDQKRRKPANGVIPRPRNQRNGFCESLQPTISSKQASTEKSMNTVPESTDKLEEKLSFSTRKKVTFDLNVKTYEDDSTQEITSYSNNEEREMVKKGEQSVKQSQSSSLSEDDSITSSMGSYPLNDRYQNCRNSDDEYEEVESDEWDMDDYDDQDEDDYFGDDDENDGRLGEEESSESFFSSPLDSYTQCSATSVTQEQKTLRSNQNVRDRGHYVHSVLNPVENLSQWKAVKAKTAPLLKLQKENSNLDQVTQIPFSSEPSFDRSKPSKQEIMVDASLSNWLGTSETKLGLSQLREASLREFTKK